MVMEEKLLTNALNGPASIPLICDTIMVPGCALMLDPGPRIVCKGVAGSFKPSLNLAQIGSDWPKKICNGLDSIEISNLYNYIRSYVKCQCKFSAYVQYNCMY
jgi:hypothetical protein